MPLLATNCQLCRIFCKCFCHQIRRLWSPLTQREEENVQGKVVIVTGANAGLGKFVATEFAKRGCVVVMGCRNLKAGEEAREEIVKMTKCATVELFHLDLADLSSIRKFCDEVLSVHPIIDVIVNNAGVLVNSSERKFTKDGFELHMGVNHLGHFLLTNLLLDAITKSDLKRIITVSSSAGALTTLTLDDLMLAKAPHLGLRNSIPYKNSKFANALFTKELQKRMNKLGIKCFSVCPGLVKTDIFREFPPTGIWKVTKLALACSLPVEKGADAILQCSLGRKVEKDFGRFLVLGNPCRQIEDLLTDELSEGLWELSRALVGLK